MAHIIYYGEVISACSDVCQVLAIIQGCDPLIVVLLQKPRWHEPYTEPDHVLLNGRFLLN